MKSDLCVSVYCLTFNHERYIRNTLDGFVKQKTDFKYKVVVHDDASTDNTQAIMHEYEEKYPELFVMLYETENQYSKGIPALFKSIYPELTTDLVCICEGDDYWCDENKLQIQYDYMKSHDKCMLCVHDTALINDDGGFIHKFINGSRRNKDYDFSDVLKAGSSGLFHTSSYMIRKQFVVNRPEIFAMKGVGDFPMALNTSYNGYVHYFGRVMSCYRVNATGSWSNRNNSADAKLKSCRAYDEKLDILDEYTGYKYTRAFDVARGASQYTIIKYTGNKSNCRKGYRRYLLLFYIYTIPRKIVSKISGKTCRKEFLPL